MNDAASISVVIPVFNASHMLEQLTERLSAVLSPSDEVVFVEDASSDDSWAVIERLVSEHPTWTGIQLGLNSGQHSALLAGIRAARNGIIVTMDDDLQHRPEDIAKLLDGLSSDVDLVYGLSRIEEHGRMRSFASRFVKRTMERSLRIPYAGSISAFRCFRASLRGRVRHRKRSVHLHRCPAFLVNQPRDHCSDRDGYSTHRDVGISIPRSCSTYHKYGDRV